MSMETELFNLEFQTAVIRHPGQWYTFTCPTPDGGTYQKVFAPEDALLIDRQYWPCENAIFYAGTMSPPLPGTLNLLRSEAMKPETEETAENDPSGETVLTVVISNRMDYELQCLVDSGHYGRDTAAAAGRLLEQALEARKESAA